MFYLWIKKKNGFGSHMTKERTRKIAATIVQSAVLGLRV